MKVYHLKVSLFGYHEQPVNQLHRIIEISENSTFEDLHDAIFEAFDRFDPHLYTFFMTKKDTKSLHDIMDASAITNPHSVNEVGQFSSKPKNAATTQIKDAKLEAKDVFQYWFDFGDDWWHRIRVDRISTNNVQEKPYVKVAKKVGESPAQYDYDNEGLVDFGEGDLEHEMMEAVEANLADIDIGQDDLLYLMQTMQGDNPESMQKVVDKYGVKTMLAMFRVVGMPESEIKHAEVMLNYFPLIGFLDTLETKDVSLQQECDLLDSLVSKLQRRMSDLEKEIADQASK